ncbi:hypothetical protein [Spiroplasma ixodetis]
MKYFSPSYWFKLWVLSATLFNDKTIGINVKSIDNKKIKDWVSNNTSLESINEPNSFTNTSNYQSYSLNETNENINPFYQTELKTSTHKHRHKKSRRIKKQVMQHPRTSKEILQLNEKLIINQNNRREYQTSFQIIINELVDRGVLRRIRDLNLLVNPDFISEDNTILALNSESNYGYFRLPVEIRGEQNGQSFSRNLELVLRTDNLYVEGLMVNNNYYHFDFSNIDNRRQPAAVRDGSVPHLTRIDRTNNINLSNIRPDYIDLLPDELSHRIYWTDIYQAFLEISNIESISLYDNIRYSLGRVIVITAESLRFWSLHTHIIQQLINNNDGYIVLQRNIENPIYS